AARLIEELGEPVVTGVPGLFRLVPEAARVAEAGVDPPAAPGLPTGAAAPRAALARRCGARTLPAHPAAHPAAADYALPPLHRGADGGAAYDALLDGDGVEPRLAARIATRATGWPDLFPADEPALLRAAGARDPQELLERSAAWRPWRGYAALHLLLADAHRAPASPTQRSRVHCTRLDRIAFLAVAALLVLAGSAFFALRADGGTRAAPSHDRPLEAAVPPRADEMPEPMALADEMRGSAHGADDMR